MTHPRAHHHDEARAIVRAGLTDVRVALGETSHDAETYQARHAKPNTWEWKPGFGWVDRSEATR